MKKLSILILLSISTLLLCSQTITSLGTGGIVELECIQSSVTNTFVASSMEIIPNSPQGNTRTVVHRSIDNGITWTLIKSIEPLPNEGPVVDPVLAQDSNGVFYLVMMRVRSFSTMPPTVDLDLYKSEDDGLTWTFVGNPYNSGLNSDYPQIVAKGNGELYLVYTLIVSLTPVSGKLIFKKSNDGGLSWSEDYELLYPASTLINIGPDISWGKNNKLHVTVGGKDTPEIYHFTSTDFGSSWSDVSISNIPNSNLDITKPISHSNFEYMGVLSHEPHNDNTPITYHSLINDTWQTYSLGNGAYAQGYITDDGNIHVIYNQLVGSDFSIKYVVSTDKGLTFTTPIVIYSAGFTSTGNGEYQSLILGSDGDFYLTFCDWGDDSRAKMLVFAPLLTGTNEMSESSFNVYPNPSNGKIFIELKNSSNVKSIKLVSIDGTTLHKLHAETGRLKYDFDISAQPAGQYIILIEEENRLLVQRVIKNK